MNSLWINAAPLFLIAREAYCRSLRERPEDGQGALRDPLVSVVFAVASMEAFINELAALAASPSILTRPPEELELGVALNDVEDGRGSLEDKFQAAKKVLTGRGYHKGRRPYQDFALLIRIRHALVHYRQLMYAPPGVWGTKPEDLPKLVRQLKGKGLTRAFGDNVRTSNLNYLDTPELAKWACNTAAAMVQSIVSVIPDGPLNDAAQLFYSPYFAEL